MKYGCYNSHSSLQNKPQTPYYVTLMIYKHVFKKITYSVSRDGCLVHTRGSAACLFLLLQRLLLLPMARLWLPRSRCVSEGEVKKLKAFICLGRLFNKQRSQSCLLKTTFQKEQASHTSCGSSGVNALPSDTAHLGWFGDSCAAS